MLVSGCRWLGDPLELGYCGEPARTRAKVWEEAGIWDMIRRSLLIVLRRQNKFDLRTSIIDVMQLQSIGGGQTAEPGPVNRPKNGYE